MSRRLVVLSGDDVGREVIPLAIQLLRLLLPEVTILEGESGIEHEWRTGQPIDPPLLAQAREVGSILMGPEREAHEAVASALVQLTELLDLFAAAYHLYDPVQGLDLLVLVEMGRSVGTEKQQPSLTPFGYWSATRLGNQAARLVAVEPGKIALAHDSELSFVHAVAGGVGEEFTAERVDAIFLLNHFAELAREFALVVASASTGHLLLSHLFKHVIAPERSGLLLLGAEGAVASPAHGPLTEQVGWGFTNPLGALRALYLLLRYHWHEEEAALRLEAAITRALARRRTPDMGGLHTMYEVSHAIGEELRDA